MLKKILQKLIRLYVAPLEWNHKIGLFAKGIMFKNKEEHIISAINFIHKKNIIQDEDVIVDAGVFNGSTIALFESNFKNNRVVGFEPNPDKFHLATERFKNNPRVKIENMAIGENDGQCEFHLATTVSASSLNPINTTDLTREDKKIIVDTTSLDSYFKDVAGVLILKLDIEGYELKALQASIEFLKKTKYVITEMNNNEYHDSGCKYYEVDEFLRNQGFKLIITIAGYNDQGLDQFDSVYENTRLTATN